jgi:ATP phosphoribosyltransferase regulatory subunit
MNSLTQIPPGTQILIGRAARRRREVERAIFSVFEGWSYEEIIPPMLDYLDVFVKGMGQELEDRIYRFIDRDGNVLALRPEFTSLVAKTAATRLASEPKPLRLSYSGEVLRFETPKGGQQREFAQIGIEHYGGEPSRADVEALLICMEGLATLGVADYQINLGHVGFLGGLVDGLGAGQEQIHELRGLLDRKDRQGLDELLGVLELEESAREALRAVPHLTGSREVILEARKLVTRERSVRTLDHLESIWDIMESLGLAGHLTIDLGELRGFDYYSGILFRAYVPGLGFEVASGGRYDGLPARFGSDVPAVGFSYSLDRLEQVIGPHPAGGGGGEEPPRNPSDFEEAVRLRKAGLKVRLCS